VSFLSIILYIRYGGTTHKSYILRMYHTTALLSIGATHRLAEDLISIKSDFPAERNNFILL
jgi:hypothetical protein